MSESDPLSVMGSGEKVEGVVQHVTEMEEEEDGELEVENEEGFVAPQPDGDIVIDWSEDEGEEQDDEDTQDETGDEDQVKMEEGDDSGDEFKEELAETAIGRVRLRRRIKTRKIPATKKGSLQFLCDICNIYYTGFYRFRQHMESHQEYHLPCDACDKLFRGDFALRRHKLNMHGDPNECPYCNDLSRYRLHQRAYPNGLCRNKPIKMSVREKRERYANDRRLICDNYNLRPLPSDSHDDDSSVRSCIVQAVAAESEGKEAVEQLVNSQSRSVSISSMNESVNHSEQREHQFMACPVCQLMIKRGTLKRHLEQHSALSFPCDQCSLTYRGPLTLKAHVTRVHLEGNRNFICDICGSKYLEQSRLEQHYAAYHLGKVDVEESLDELKPATAPMLTTSRQYAKRKHSSTMLPVEKSSGLLLPRIGFGSGNGRATTSTPIKQFEDGSQSILMSNRSLPIYKWRPVPAELVSKMAIQYLCGYCNASFTAEPQLELHMATHRTFECIYCHHLMANEDAVVKHERLLHWVYRCRSCAFACVGWRNYQIHWRQIHSTVRQLQPSAIPLMKQSSSVSVLAPIDAIPRVPVLLATASKQ